MIVPDKLVQITHSQEKIMEKVVVSRIKDNVIDELFVFVGEQEKTSTEAEEKFLEMCREYCTNFEQYDEDDISDILNDGYVMLGNGSICISWDGNI